MGSRAGPTVMTFSTATPTIPLPERSAEAIPVSAGKYDPAPFGIPEQVGDFEIVAVVSPDQNPCTPQGALMVMFTFPDSAPQDTLTQAFQQAEAEIKVINPNIIMISAGPMEDRAAFFNQLDQNSRTARADAAAGRCGVIMGGPSGPSGLNPPEFPTLPPAVSLPMPESSAEILPESSAEALPVDPEKFSPARYGIPETLGGYKVVAVIVHENDPCTQEDIMDVMFEAPEPTLDEYLQGSANEMGPAFEELQKLYPNARTSVIGPVQDVDELYRRLEQSLRDEIGRECVSLGGPFVPGEEIFVTQGADQSQPFQLIATPTPMQ